MVSLYCTDLQNSKLAAVYNLQEKKTQIFFYRKNEANFTEINRNNRKWNKSADAVEYDFE